MQLLRRGTNPEPSDSEVLGTWGRSEQSIQCWTPTAAVQTSLCDLGQAPPVKCGRGRRDSLLVPLGVTYKLSTPVATHSCMGLLSFLRGHLLTGNRQKLYLASWIPEPSGLAHPTRCHLGGEVLGSSPVMTPSPGTTRLPRATPPLHKPLTCHRWPPRGCHVNRALYLPTVGKGWQLMGGER